MRKRFAVALALACAASVFGPAVSAQPNPAQGRGYYYYQGPMQQPGYLLQPGFQQPAVRQGYREPARPLRARPTHRRHHAKTEAKHHRVHAAAKEADLRPLAEREGFRAVSNLVNFPKFFPGLGIIYVKPDTLPLGPFVCFDRDGRLVATVYMVPVKDMDDHKTFEGAAPSFAGKVDHVTIYFNGGHPGVDMPHYHIVLWHVSKADEARVAK